MRNHITLKPTFLPLFNNRYYHKLPGVRLKACHLVSGSINKNMHLTAEINVSNELSYLNVKIIKKDLQKLKL